MQLKRRNREKKDHRPAQMQRKKGRSIKRATVIKASCRHPSLKTQWADLPSPTCKRELPSASSAVPSLGSAPCHGHSGNPIAGCAPHQELGVTEDRDLSPPSKPVPTGVNPLRSWNLCPVPAFSSLPEVTGQLRATTFLFDPLSVLHCFRLHRVSLTALFPLATCHHDLRRLCS